MKTIYCMIILSTRSTEKLSCVVTFLNHCTHFYNEKERNILLSYSCIIVYPFRSREDCCIFLKKKEENIGFQEKFQGQSVLLGRSQGIF